jgi:S-adenosylmethionine/arginine decarboxylase-like enzyme
MKQTRKNRIRNTRKISKRPTWGYHLTVDARDCDPEAMRSKSTIAAFSKELVDAIDMVAYGPPQIVMFGNGYRKGYTLVQLIETSNIAAHFVEETNDIYLDIFSCKKFKVGDGIAVFQKYFKPSHIKKRFITRRA